MNTVVVVLRVETLPDPRDVDAWRELVGAGQVTACAGRRDASAHLAARLAGRRACVEALGTGHDEAGVVIVGGFGERPRAAWRSWDTAPSPAGEVGVEVSLSHAGGFAGACALRTDGQGGCACGLDLLDAHRWQRALSRLGSKLAERMTSPRERQRDRAAGLDTVAHSGRRFSAKEAVIKSLGGLPRGGSFHDIDVIFADHGDAHPQIALQGASGRRAAEIGVVEVMAEVAPLDTRLICTTVATRGGRLG